MYVFLLVKVPISPKLVLLHITVKNGDLEVRAIELETRIYSVIVLSLYSALEAEVSQFLKISEGICTSCLIQNLSM
jgi:hypothetical protein